jgi:D-tyrosyl-tRNA(Tyr) deacylase
MRLLIQRVVDCSLRTPDGYESSIEDGLLAYLGIGKDDTEKDADYLAHKLINLRVFEDNQGKMNLSPLQLGKEIMVVSQFTLYGDVRQGLRPDFMNAMAPEGAEKMCGYFVSVLKKSPLRIQTGVFRAHMEIKYTNVGPISLIIESQKVE